MASTVWRVDRVITFSILGRIGGDATEYPHPVSQPAQSFSILGRIGGDATRSWTQHGTARRALSVSSVGSEAMQLYDRARAQSVAGLSVSSVGSEAMQLLQRLRRVGVRFLSVSSVGSEAMQRGQYGVAG